MKAAGTKSGHEAKGALVATARNDYVASSMTKSEAAYQTLRRWIERGQLQPGAKVTVAQVANTLGLSATPVREAIRLLQSEGLLEARPHFAAVVKEFSLERIAEVYRLRCLLEPLAARLAAEHATADDIAEIDRTHKSFNKAAAVDAHEAIAWNARWHRAIAKASASAVLQDFINRLWTTLINQGLWATGHAELSAAQHESIMRAIKDHNGDAAAEAMARHCESGASFTQGLRGDRGPGL